jgi:hypothetical protein
MFMHALSTSNIPASKTVKNADRARWGIATPLKDPQKGKKPNSTPTTESRVSSGVAHTNAALKMKRGAILTCNATIPLKLTVNGSVTNSDPNPMAHIRHTALQSVILFSSIGVTQDLA